jgi:uncharacterized protein YndB with AHSA1/START domain
MTDPSSPSQTIARLIRAPRHALYQAFLDPARLVAWQAPDTMRAQVHVFEPRVGGQFRLSLTYTHPDPAQPGKTASDTDTYHGRFVTLIPDEQIVEAIEFETADAAMQGEMTLTVTLADDPGGTEVALRYDHLPPGVRPEDNATGTRQSLAKLAALVE